jgi:hypothetical protein
MRRALAGLLAAASVSACQRCGSGGAGQDGGKNGESLSVSFPKAIDAPEFRALESLHGYGIPAGCTFDGPVRRAELREQRARFVAAKSDRARLALGVGTNGEVERAGLVDFEAHQVEPVPWAVLDAPPLLDRSASGWLGAWSVPGEPGHGRLLAWRGGERATVVLEGDGLEVADVTCAEAGCAVLTTLARASGAPGATLALERATGWQRVDLDAGAGEPWRPLAIAKLGPGATSIVALASDTHSVLFRVEDGKAERGAVLDTPFKAYDALLLDGPALIAPGADVDRPCDREEFPIDVVTEGGARHTLRTPAAPESITARALGKGGLVAWVAPVSCQHLERRVVYLTLLSPSGAPAASPMAVADASGFALATSGQSASLWLLQDRAIAWVRLRCEP